jgi:hypothetical protein
MAIGIRYSSTTRTRLISNVSTTFHGIQVGNASPSGVTIVVSDSDVAGVTAPWAMWLVAKPTVSVIERQPFMPFMSKGVRMVNGIWLQMLGAVSAVTATVYHGG